MLLSEWLQDPCRHKPFCALCEERVEWMECRINPVMAGLCILIGCHGEEERVSISEWDVMRYERIEVRACFEASAQRVRYGQQSEFVYVGVDFGILPDFTGYYEPCPLCRREHSIGASCGV